MQEKFSICIKKILKVVSGNSQSTAISTPNYQSFPLPIIKILARYLVGILSVYRRVRVSYASASRSSYFAWLKRLFLCLLCKLARRTYFLTVHRTLCGAPVPLHGHRSVGRLLHE